MASETKAGSPRSNVALLGLAAAGILGGLLVLFATIAGFNPFAPKITVTTYFTNSEGLKSGAAVNLNGVTVGTVKRVDLISAPERRKTPVQVTMKLKTKFLSGLHTDSLAELTSMGALADTVVDIDSQHATGPPLQDGAELLTLNTPTVLNLKAGQDTANDVRKLMDRLDPLVDQVKSGKGSIGQLMSNPNLTAEARGTIAKVHAVSAKLDRTNNTAGKMLNDHSIANRLASLSSDLQGVQTSVGKLTNGPLQANLATAQAQTSALMEDVKHGHGAVGMVMNDAAFKSQMAGVGSNARATIKTIESGNGTTGKMLSQDAFQVSLNRLGTESSTLAAKIRQNPKKYLTIEIRLF